MVYLYDLRQCQLGKTARYGKILYCTAFQTILVIVIDSGGLLMLAFLLLAECLQLHCVISSVHLIFTTFTYTNYVMHPWSYIM